MIRLFPPRKDLIKIAACCFAVLAIHILMSRGIQGTFHGVVTLYLVAGFLKTLLYLLVLLGSIAGVVVLLLSANPWVRIPSWILAFVSTSVVLGYKAVNTQGFEYEDAQTMLRQSHFIGQALKTFHSEGILAVALAAVGCAILAVGAQQYMPRIKSVFGIFAVFMAILVYAVMHRTRGRLSDFPAFYKVPLLTIAAKNTRLPYGPRSDVRLLPDARPLAKHIVSQVSGYKLLNIN